MYLQLFPTICIFNYTIFIATSDQTDPYCRRQLLFFKHWYRSRKRKTKLFPSFLGQNELLPNCNKDIYNGKKKSLNRPTATISYSKTYFLLACICKTKNKITFFYSAQVKTLELTTSQEYAYICEYSATPLFIDTNPLGSESKRITSIIP